MGFLKQQETIFLLVTISLFSLKLALAESIAEDFIKKSCKSSEYPDLCYTSLAPFAGQVQQSLEKLANVSMTFCLSKVKPLKSHIEELCKKATNPNLSYHLRRCAESFDIAVDAINDSIEQFKNIGAPGAIRTVQIYMSGALTCEDDCKDFMNDMPDGPEKKDVVNRTDWVEKLTSISLAMLDLFAHN